MNGRGKSASVFKAIYRTKITNFIQPLSKWHDDVIDVPLFMLKNNPGREWNILKGKNVQPFCTALDILGNLTVLEIGALTSWMTSTARKRCINAAVGSAHGGSQRCMKKTHLKKLFPFPLER